MNLIAALEITVEGRNLGIILADMDVERCPFRSDATFGNYKFKVVGLADRDDPDLSQKFIQYQILYGESG